MECALDAAPPPSELRLAWQCTKWHALPDMGGIYDQDYATMLRMNYTMSIYNAVVRIRSLKGKAIHQLTDNERKILRMLMDMGILFRG